MPITRCRFAGTTQPRQVSGKHAAECASPESCRGCAPCEARHCVVCTVVHVEHQTCEKCVARVREDLRHVFVLDALVLGQAFFGGSEGRLEAARTIPGGMATVLLSPTAQSEAHSNKRMSAIMGRVNDEHLDDDREVLSALWVLPKWEDVWRNARDEMTDLNVTVQRAHYYLDRNLRWAAQHTDDFDEFASELASSRALYESVLGAGSRDDEAGLRCFDCNGKLVRKMTAKGYDDFWTCKRCQRVYTDPEYHLAVRAKLESTR